MSMELQTTSMAIDPARVAHETVEGEVIIIQLEKGNYFSLRGSGREVWDLLGAGVPPAEVASVLRDRYDADPGQIEDFVAELVSELLAEALLDDSSSEGSNGRGAPAVAGDRDRAPFAPSALEKYTDMQDYLLIDPIHDVTEAGWPTLPRDG